MPSTKSTQEQHYDRIADAYAQARQGTLCNALYYAALSETLFGLIPAALRQRGDLTIVDPMCGSGELLADALAYLGDRVAAFYGVDLSARMLAHALPAIRDDPRGRLLKGDIRALALADACADIVMIRGGLHHVHRDLDTTVREIRRVLKTSGVFIFFEPSDDNVAIELARSILYRKHDFFVAEEEKGLKAKPLAASLARSGFRASQIRPFGYLAYTLIGNTDVFPLFRRLRSRRLIRALIALDRGWEKVPLLNRLNLAFVGAATA